jgi:FkbM family methyltransferase
MFGFQDVVTPPAMTVVDIGAMDLPGERDPFARLSAAGLLTVIGFEPLAEECLKLNALGSRGRRYLPYAIADGRRRTLYVTNTGMTSSLLRPNLKFAELFQNLAELMQVVATQELETRRLDDVAEVREHGCDLLKLDTQGSELEILSNALETLSRCLIIQTEVEFVPLYENQPLFADVDQLLRARGFMFHRFFGLSGRAFKPLVAHNDQNRPLSQALWAEAIYVPDLARWEAIEPPALLKLAALMHEVYGSFDLCHLVLATHDRRTGSSLAGPYLARLTAGGA